MLVSMAGERTQNIDVRDLTRELPRVVARRQTRRILKTVAGATFIAAGIAFMVVPFIPGFPLLLLGLAVLATEFHWARRMQVKIRSRLRIGRRRSGRTR
jgi:type III secretory pathway component EscV